GDGRPGRRPGRQPLRLTGGGEGRYRLGRPATRDTETGGQEMARYYQVISADGHVETPPDPWVRYVPDRWKERAPRLVALPDGGEGWVIEGQPLLKNGQNITGRGPISFDTASYFKPDGSPNDGAGPAEQRLREQDEDGIDAEVLFPPVFATRFLEGI